MLSIHSARSVNKYNLPHVILKSRKKIAGFTLAEVLLTLIVVGVISALVIPLILQRIQDAELKAAFKNNYSIIEQATKRLVIDNAGSLTNVFTGDTVAARCDNFKNKYSQYFSYVKTCNYNDIDTVPDADGHWYIMSNCWSKYNYLLNKSLGTDNSAQYSHAVLNNGVSMNFALFSTGCTNNRLSTNDVCGIIIIDVNGIKAPNQYGRDLFAVLVTKTGVVPSGTQTDTTNYNMCDPNGIDTSGHGFGCAAYIMQNKDY